MSSSAWQCEAQLSIVLKLWSNTQPALQTSFAEESLHASMANAIHYPAALHYVLWQQMHRNTIPPSSQSKYYTKCVYPCCFVAPWQDLQLTEDQQQ